MFPLIQLFNYVYQNLPYLCQNLTDIFISSSPYWCQTYRCPIRIHTDFPQCVEQSRLTEVSWCYRNRAPVLTKTMSFEPCLNEHRKIRLSVPVHISSTINKGSGFWPPRSPVAGEHGCRRLNVSSSADTVLELLFALEIRRDCLQALEHLWERWVSDIVCILIKKHVDVMWHCFTCHVPVLSQTILLQHSALVYNVTITVYLVTYN